MLSPCPLGGRPPGAFSTWGNKLQNTFYIGPWVSLCPVVLPSVPSAPRLPCLSPTLILLQSKVSLNLSVSLRERCRQLGVDGVWAVCRQCASSASYDIMISHTPTWHQNRLGALKSKQTHAPPPLPMGSHSPAPAPSPQSPGISSQWPQCGLCCRSQSLMKVELLNDWKPACEQASHYRDLGLLIPISEGGN